LHHPFPGFAPLNPGYGSEVRIGRPTATSAWAQTPWLSANITIVVPFTPGGLTDITSLRDR
jgi:hypothetical protein